MFHKWGDFSYRHRRVVPLVVVLAILVLYGLFGLKLGDRLSQEGWDDPNSASTAASTLELETFGRDNDGDVIILVPDPDNNFNQAADYLRGLQTAYPDQIDHVSSYFDKRNPNFLSQNGSTAFAAIGLKGDDEQTLKDYRTIEDALYATDLPIQVAGATAVADALDDGMTNDIARAEKAALPLVGLLLLVVFGSVTAALMPLVVGGLSILGSLGILSVLAGFLQVNTFAQAVVTLLGLGLAIDYGLFMVSRFREELDRGRDTRDAVAVTTATAGQTVVFSALSVAVALSGLFLFPQAFLKSVAYGAISAVGLAALLSVTVLPALFGLLGKRIDFLTLRRTKRTARTVKDTWWYTLPRWTMRHAKLMTVAIAGLMVALTLPILSITFGGINETYLPPDQPTRVAQDQFNEQFPAFRTEPVKLVVEGATNQQLAEVYLQVRGIQGLTEPMSPATPTKDGTTVLAAGIQDRADYARIVHELEAVEAPEGVNLYVGGTPAMEVESLDALFHKLPWMFLYMLVATFILMALVFGSLILPAKAIIMTLLTAGATLGILTAMFVLGAGAGLLNFTPGPLMSPVLVLIIAIIYGLSTDYEVFLVSRMVEARREGKSTDESIAEGTAHTGGIITAAALIMIVVAGAFGFSDIVMMKYIAFGMIFALALDATIVRMLLVPAVMHLLREDNWWAPGFVRRAAAQLSDVAPATAAATAVAAEPEAAPEPEPEMPLFAGFTEGELTVLDVLEPTEDAAASEATTATTATTVTAPDTDALDAGGTDAYGADGAEEAASASTRGGRTTDNDDSLVPFDELIKRLHERQNEE